MTDARYTSRYAPADQTYRSMVVRHRAISFPYRAAASLVILLGILRVTGLLTGSPTWTAFLYYTVLSNALCLVWMAWSAIVTLRAVRQSGWVGASSPSARGAGAVMMAITVTMLIYLFVLAPSLFTQPGSHEPFTLTDNLIHIVTPLLVIIDWLLFVPKGWMLPFDPLWWTVIPYAYLVFAFSYSALGGRFAAGTRYPYPFLDVGELGVAAVAGWIAALSVALVAIGYLYFGLDRLLGRGRVRPERPRPLRG